jgi:FAD synthetase
MSRFGHCTKKPIRTVFITYPNPFPHVDEFVKICIQRYQLDCRYIPGPMKQALQHYLDSTMPRPKGIFVGIRRNDPYAGKKKHSLIMVDRPGN